MKLGARQELFMRLLPRLIDKAHELGFEVRGGDLFRDPRAHGEYGESLGPYGAPDSNHKLKCAIDLNLRKGDSMIWSTEGHRELGTFWETLHPMCRWGGRFNDGNHYELLEWRDSNGIQ